MNKETMIACLKEVRAEMTWKKIACIILGAAICTFGVHNIHQRVEITEGGIIGLMRLGIPSAVITPVLDIICYAMAFRLFGGKFIVISMISTLSVSAFYEIWELLPPMLPDLSSMPVAAAIAGGLFVGIGTGLIVRQGGSGGGDDALALTISRVTGWKLATSYLSTDMMILFLSLSYISPVRIACSVLTVCISSAAIDVVKNYSFSSRISEKEKELSCAETLEKTQEL